MVGRKVFIVQWLKDKKGHCMMLMLLKVGGIDSNFFDLTTSNIVGSSLNVET
jgi:hypothetical protein